MNEQPEFVLICGGPGAGKTRFRKERFASGYLTLDAGEIFIFFSNDEYFAFPSHLEAEMEAIGQKLANDAVENRLNIVTEMIGDSVEDVNWVVTVMKAVGYKTKFIGITCDIDVAMQRNLARGDDNISAHFTQKYHQKWLIIAARNYARKHKI